MLGGNETASPGRGLEEAVFLIMALDSRLVLMGKLLKSLLGIQELHSKRFDFFVLTDYLLILFIQLGSYQTQLRLLKFNRLFEAVQVFEVALLVPHFVVDEILVGVRVLNRLLLSLHHNVLQFLEGQKELSPTGLQSQKIPGTDLLENDVHLLDDVEEFEGILVLLDQAVLHLFLYFNHSLKTAVLVLEVLSPNEGLHLVPQMNHPQNQLLNGKSLVVLPTVSGEKLVGNGFELEVIGPVGGLVGAFLASVNDDLQLVVFGLHQFNCVISDVEVLGSRVEHVDGADESHILALGLHGSSIDILRVVRDFLLFQEGGGLVSLSLDSFSLKMKLL